MGKSDDPFGSQPPKTDAFGRPISHSSDDAFGSPSGSDDAFGSPAPQGDPSDPPAERDDPFGSPPDLVKRPSAADAWRAAPPPGAGDAWRAAPPPDPAGPWPAAPPPDADGGAGAPARNVDTAVPALVLGILGVFCGILAPFAWALGRKAERDVDASGGTLGGRGMGTAGKILGIIGTVLLILGILFIVLGIAFGVSSVDSGGPATTFES